MRALITNGATTLFICLFLLSACNEAKTEHDIQSLVEGETKTIKEPVEYVWPWLDSANSRWFYFNSATRPFGMVNLSPDTEIEGAWGSGYRYNTEEVKGFNHVHAWQLAGPSVMPMVTESAAPELDKNYFSGFSHQTETVKAGYHKLTLDRYNIDVELTSTTRVGFHRYTYKAAKNRKVLFDLQGKFGPSELSKGEFTQISAQSFSGSIVNAPTIRRPRATPIFFYVEVDTPILNLDETSERVLLGFADGDAPILMKVAISYVDEMGAKQNMQQELSSWQFDDIVKEATEDWNAWLSKIKVTGSSEQDKTRFYTDLFHALQGRRIISDVDGRYSDQTQPERKIKQIPMTGANTPQFNHHNSDSFWGAQWTIQTLWPLAYPKVASDFSRSMLAMYKDGGFIPRGPSGGNYTHVMTGATATPFFVSNYMKGIRDFDVELAYQALKKNHLPGGTMGRAGYEHDSAYSGGLEYYIDLGYVPYPLPPKNGAFHQDGAGQTLEYSFQDWTLAQLALALGKFQDSDYFLKRSQNYKNIYDAETGYMRPKNIEGHWKPNFNPLDYQHGFVESNSAQMTWFVPHDLEGLAELMGGKSVASVRLNKAFEVASKQGFTSGSAHHEETNEENRKIPINYGNQPSIQTAFLFNELGNPHLTQYWTREIVNSVYSNVSSTDGFNGDEDQGLMGSLSVLLKIGLFQVDGGTSKEAIYQIGSPIFDRIEIALDETYYPGKSFVIETLNNSNSNRYVQSVLLNGKRIQRFYLTHQEIVAGGVLQLEMGDEPRHSGE